jgi:hypothetical protein
MPGPQETEHWFTLTSSSMSVPSLYRAWAKKAVAGLAAADEVRHRQPSRHDGIGAHAELAELGEEAVIHPLAEERLRPYLRHHGTERIEQIELTLIAKTLDELRCLGFHHSQVTLKLAALEPGQHYLALPLVFTEVISPIFS